MSEDKIMKMFSNCVPVKGHKRSVIYDLCRNEFKFIPNELYKILTTFENKTKEYILKQYSNDVDTVLEYFNFLIENEYIFWVDKKEIKRFPKIEFTTLLPGSLSSLIIECDLAYAINWQQLAKDSFSLGVKHIGFCFGKSIQVSELQMILSAFSKWPFRGLILNLHYNSILTKEVLNDFHLKFEQVSNIDIYQSPYNEKCLFERKSKCEIRFLNESFNTSDTEKISLFRNFRISMQSFSEAQLHNLFYNRKLIIVDNKHVHSNSYDEKICIEYKDISSIKNAINSNQIKQIWNTSKDQIKVCCDCEFRYMCASRNIPSKNKNEQSFQKSECSYNPYLGLWKGDEDYKTLKECNILNDENGFYIPPGFPQ